MTTTVTIESHVQDHLRVRIRVTENGETVMEQYAQDGEVSTVYVYDNRCVEVQEVPAPSTGS